MYYVLCKLFKNNRNKVVIFLIFGLVSTSSKKDNLASFLKLKDKTIVDKKYKYYSGFMVYKPN